MNNVVQSPSARTWTFPRKMVGDISALTLMTWFGFLITVLGITLAINRWGTLENSIWEQASQLAQWFLLFMGVYIGSELLPQYVTHGKTRRDFFVESGITIAILSAGTALLMVVGWVVERILFNQIDVAQTIQTTALYDSARDYPMIALDSLVVLAIWALGGLYISAAWYRDGSEGLLSIIPALVIASLVDLAMGSRVGPLGSVIRELFDPEHPPIGLTLVASIAGISALAFLAWRMIRDIPIRNVAA